MVLLVRSLHQFPLAVAAKLVVLGIAQHLYPIPRTVSVVLLGSVGCANLSRRAVTAILADVGRLPGTALLSVVVRLDNLSVIPAIYPANWYHFASILTSAIASPANP